MTQEQVEKLLQPRYKLIADYPSNIDDTGTVYEIDLSDGYGIDFEMTCKKYSHLFRKLEWWEEREVSEMPEYLKDTSDGIVYKVEYRARGTNNIEYRIGISWISLHFGTHVKPATEQDYLNYKNNQ